MAQYEPLVFTEAEQKIVDVLKLHARDMFPTAQPAGHDWQHTDSQTRLWQTVGGSVLKEPRFAEKVDYMVPFFVSLSHDLNRLSVFMPMSKFSKKELTKFSGQKLDDALAHNENADALNDRARLRMLGMFDGFLRRLDIPPYLRQRVMAVMEYSGGANSPSDPPEYIITDDLDKAITGPIYAWRCACVGAGQLVKRDVVKKYLIAKLSGESERLQADEKLESWLGDLEWAEDWDPCVAKTQDYVIRSAVLHKIADPGFEILRRIRSETIEQLQTIGYNI